ncbi:MAG TPA: CHAT domain-containing protein [Blastocatellia bacterium]|nr:CHAT domain-containing protein [Blastocatellia bacterium]
MKSFRLKLEQIDSGNGRLRLWDTDFPSNNAQPIADGTFTLDPLINRQRAGDATRVEMLSFVQGDSNSYPGRFEAIGDTLRTLIKPSGVLDRWLELREPGTRTYFETGSIEDEVEPKLADLPWEYLARVEGGVVEDRYFADTEQILIRVHKGTAPVHDVRLVKGLIITGEPLDWEKYIFPTEDVSSVARAFQKCKHCSHLELLETPTLEQLETRLDQLKPEFIHFSGHGELSPQSNLPSLRISVPGNPWWWDTNKISNTFRLPARVPRLVVLNACDTGQSGGDLYSVMRVLQRRGAVAVVGTQAAIGQDATQVFSRVFYQELSAGHTVDVAMAAARLKLGGTDNGDWWSRRDWGLYVLSMSTPADQLWKTTEPSERAMGCATLKEFYREEGNTAPFVALGASEARREFVTALQSSNSIVVKGPEGCGKTWLVRRSLRDAVSFGYRVQYVSLDSLGSDANFVELLKAIREGDLAEQKRGSHIHEPLPEEPFAGFYSAIKDLNREQIANLPEAEIKRICESFESGLEEAAKGAPLTIVLDQFSRRKAATPVSFSPAEFTKDGVKDIWKHIAGGQLKNVQLLIAVIVDKDLDLDEYSKYHLDALQVKPIELSAFRSQEFGKLFFEFFRFARTIQGQQGSPLDLNLVRQVFWGTLVPATGWRARVFERIRLNLE